jgi:hypothetical protein
LPRGFWVLDFEIRVLHSCRQLPCLPWEFHLNPYIRICQKERSKIRNPVSGAGWNLHLERIKYAQRLSPSTPGDGHVPGKAFPGLGARRRADMPATAWHDPIGAASRVRLILKWR